MFEPRWRNYRRPVGRSWRVDETYLVDKAGQTVDFCLREHRDTEAVKAFFRRAMGREKVTLDGYQASHRAVEALKHAGWVPQRTEVRLLRLPQSHHRTGPSAREVTGQPDAGLQPSMGDMIVTVHFQMPRGIATLIGACMCWLAPVASVQAAQPGIGQALEEHGQGLGQSTEDTARIVKLLADALHLDREQIALAQGHLRQRLEGIEPSPRAHELAARIPADADPYMPRPQGDGARASCGCPQAAYTKLRFKK